MSAIAQSHPLQVSAGESRAADILVFAIPFLQFVKLNVVGVLYASEIVLIATFLYFAVNRKLRRFTPVSKTFLAVCAAWLASQIVTDVVLNTAFADYARGWSRIAMTLIAFSVLYVLLNGQQQRFVIYGWGLVIGGALEFLINPVELANTYPWKFGLSYPATLGVFLLASRAKSGSYWPIVASAAIGCVNIVAATRSRGAVCLAVALCLLITLPARRQSQRTFGLNTKSRLMVIGAFAVSIAGIAWIYQYASSSGILGQVAQEEYQEQSTGEYGVLLGGRSAILGSIPAIYDSPILGHGSWARDPFYVLAQLQAMAAMGYENVGAIETEELEEGYVPAHSCIFGAWVEAGIVGAIFWGWVLVFTIKSLLRVHSSNTLMLPLVFFCALSLAWDLVFSPYGTQSRIIVPYYLVMLMTQL